MSTAAYGRSKSGDRFYNPPARRQLQQQQLLLLQQKQQQQQQDDDKIDEIRSEKQQINRRHKSEDVNGKLPDFDDCASTSTTTITPTTNSNTNTNTNMNTVKTRTNLDKFMEYTTPSLPANYFSKTNMKELRIEEGDLRPYFMLSDLWESFKEWSAYGAGVPVLLNGTDLVVQYYVPYLSAIQLYTRPSKPSPKTRMAGEETHESSRETSSDGSSDCEIERGPNSFGVCRPKDDVKSNLQGMKGLSPRVKPLSGLSSDEGESFSSPGDLIFEYFESNVPFSREPLAEKISDLSSRFPELKTCRSCDLSPSSWISVAWYPIYRIPTGPTLQNLESCFLTFHHLSTPVSGGQNEWQCHFGSGPAYFSKSFETTAVKLPLPIFGMAYYKFKVSMWDQEGVEESPKVNSLMRAADEWLRHLNVNHHDYQYFTNRKSWR